MPSTAVAHSGRHAERACYIPHSSVTQPSDALFTFLMYL